MRLEEPAGNAKKFAFRWSGRGKRPLDFEADLAVPLGDSVDDYAAFLAAERGLPCYARDELHRQLADWLRKETLAELDAQGWEAIRAALEKGKEGEEGGRPQSQGERRREDGAAEDRRWAAAWQSLVDRGLLPAFWQRQDGLRRQLTQLLRERDMEMEGLRRREEAVMSRAVQSLHDDAAQASQTASRHFAHLHQVHANYDTQIAALKTEQRRELRHLALQLADSDEPQLLLPPPSEPTAPAPAEEPRDAPSLDESYTIYLGAQLKTMHNLRMTAMDGVEGLCRRSEGSLAQSRRLQLALELYGTNLSALVLLVPPEVCYHKSFRSEFWSVCEESVELHFPSLEEQLEEVLRERGSERLEPGEVYVTRHSSLEGVEVVFHLVVPEGGLGGSDVSSRSAAVGGLRSLVRLCGAFHVGRLALPLLLVEALGEEHTVQWCLRRSELVLKCVKGFLMEGAAGGSHSYTLSFLLPPNTPAPLFASLSALLPQIYHLVGTKTQTLSVSQPPQ